MKKKISKRPSLVEVVQKVEDVVDQKRGRTYNIVDASYWHRGKGIKKILACHLLRWFRRTVSQLNNFSFLQFKCEIFLFFLFEVMGMSFCTNIDSK